MKNNIILLIMLLSLGASAQTVTVVDRTSLQPLAMVAVTNERNELVGYTGDNGVIDLSVRSPFSQVSFFLPGYEQSSLLRDALSNGQLVYLNSKSFNMQEVVISSSRFEESRQDVAQQIRVISRKEIELANQRTTADLIQESGQVFVQRSQFGGGSPTIRGFEASRVLLVVDGVRMNNAIYRAGHLQNIISMDQASLERVEIVYGPGSVVYGSDALGGVIHFYTKDPRYALDDDLRVEANAFARYGSAASELTSHIDLNLGTRRFASLTSVTYSDFGDLRTGGTGNPAFGGFGYRPVYADRINDQDTVIVNGDSTIQVGTAYSQLDVMQKFIFRQNERVSHQLNFQYSTSSDIPRYDRLTEPGGDGTGLRYAQWYYGPQDRLMAAYRLKVIADSRLYDRIRLLASYQNVKESRNDRRFGNDNLRHRYEEVGVTGANLDLEKHVGDHEIRYGLEAYLNDVTSTAEVEDITTGELDALDTRYPDGGSTMNSWSAYVTHTWEISEQLILNDGIRFNATQLSATFIDTTFFPFPYSSIEQNNSAVTGSLGLVWMPAEPWRFTLSASTGYRTPNVDDVSKVFDSEPGRVVVPNPELSPEYTYNLDLGISRLFADKVLVEVIGWGTLFRNALTIMPGTFNGEDSILYDGELSEVVQLTNAAKAYLYGVSATLRADITSGFSAFSTITYTYGRVETDTTPYPLDHIPPVFGRTGCTLQLDKFRCDAYVMYQGWKRIEDYNIVGGEDNEQYATPYGMPAWYTLNLKAGYAISEKLTLQAGIDNITDQHYRVFASGVSAPGRNLYLTVRASI